MTVKELYDFLNEMAPFSYAMDFDNCGILVGNPDEQVKKILVCLDCTPQAIARAKEVGANLIVTHHPVIFSPLKSVTADSIVYALLGAGISVICAHTNLDLARNGVNDALAHRLGLKCLEGLSPVSCQRGAETVTEYLGRVSFLPQTLSPLDFAQHVKDSLGGNVRFVCGNRPVRRVAVCGGAGADCLDEAIQVGADALVTSEVKHHIFLSASQRGITLVDAGHFHTEDVVIQPLCESLQDHFKALSIVPYHLDVIHCL